MFNFSKKKKYDLVAPVNGTMIKLEDLPDEMFAMMGQGVAFRYDDHEVCSPADGKIIMVANTLHAIGIEMKNGAQLLIHIGMDTVDLNGQGFHPLVKVGDRVSAGDPLMEIDRGFMKEKGIDLSTPVIVTNASDYHVTLLEADEVVKGSTQIMSIEK
ncbi:MAG: PTS glucose transporter subunit IIA [Intestinibaculum porci]|uniref:PTS sugar transporter subunit IIA n=1 Tax=Intestinibaculum porci TaxID=2487118 RepID=UPI003F0385C3